MDCELCHTPGPKKFYCDRCLNERLLIHKNALQRLRASLDTRVQNAAENLQAPGGVRERRTLKARRDALISNLTSLESKQTSCAEQLQSNKSIVLEKRKQLAIRKNRLLAVRSRFQTQQINLNSTHRPRSSSSRVQDSNQIIAQKITSIQKDWDQILENLTLVRKKLIVQLCSIYTITASYTTHQSISAFSTPAQIQQQQQQQQMLQRQGSHHHHERTASKIPSVNKINPRLSWKIMGLSLPVSTEIKSYHHEQTSAATLYTSHLIRLIALYLGIKLPFQMIMGPFLSIRAPVNSIWSNRHPSPYPLHIPNSMVYSSGSQVSQVAFLSGLCMLAINAHYLLITQQPQSKDATIHDDNDSRRPRLSTTNQAQQPSSTEFKPTDLLKNLYTLCRTRPIGHCSHLTGKYPLCRPDDLTHSDVIDLDALIKEVLQSKMDDSVDDGWSII